MLFMGIVVCNAAIGIIQEIRVKKLIDSISIIHQTQVKKLIDKDYITIGIGDIAAGDCILLENGDQLAADGIVYDVSGLEVNESLLTGESRPVLKKDGDVIYSGSFIVAGEGKCRITHIKEDSYASKLIIKAKTKRRATSEMQTAIKKIIKYVSFAIIPIGITLYTVQRVSEGVSHSSAIIGTTAGIIGMIPEGLVLLTSVSFTLGVGRLARKRALVQEMEAIEALARINVLCCDKTGTITTGNLEVSNTVPLAPFTTETIDNIMCAMTYAYSEKNATGKALSDYFPPKTKQDIIGTLPFSSERKYSGVTFEEWGSFVLGAPDIILSGEQEKPLLKMSSKYTRKGCRVLLLARVRELKRQTDELNDIVPYALIILNDEIREDAPETFQFFEHAGVKIKVISGDDPATVSYIALKAGLKKAGRYIDAGKLPEDMDELCYVINNYTVFGRVTPEQKQRIIHAFQRSGKTTGMVGDGVNDVLAIKDADCGIAMAAGSSAAKQSAHIVLMDSDFKSMTNIVDEGRTIIANIERVSALYLTKTIYSVLLCALFIILRQSYPFIPIQLSLIGGTAIGIPSFFLTLEKNTKVVSGGFLRRVFRISLPCALLIVIGIGLVSILAPLIGLSNEIVSTVNLIIGGVISILVVFFVSFPMNRKRVALCILISFLFTAGLLFFPDFFGIKETFLGIR
jgi:cation-transporting ATPase E